MTAEEGVAGPHRIARALGLPEPTDEQAAVIAAPVEPALVVAGAGAGKTETMAARVVWLVANGLVSAEQVLGLTFTRKAARQLADRVRARLRRLAGSGLLDELDPGGARTAEVQAGEPTILTYHAYAGRLVAEHGLLLPVEPGVRVLTETAAWQLAHRVVSTWAGDIDTDKAPATITAHVLRLSGELAEHLVDAGRLTSYSDELCKLIGNAPLAPRQRKSELPVALREVLAAQRLRVSLLPLVEAYGQAKRREATVDFADQMALAARLATEHEQVAAGERERFAAVLLDEYQDTGHAQRVLLRTLFGCGRALPVTSVGDPAQAIYGWRGASAANLPRFTTDFPVTIHGRLAPARRYGLLTSFRNPPQVLALANEVSGPLRAAGLQVDELRARDGAPAADIACALLPDVIVEREWLAAEVAARWQARAAKAGTPPTAAVLVRRRSDMAEIAGALRARGLPVEVVGIGGLLDEPEVRDLVSALRVLIDPLAGVAAARLLTGARWRLGAADLDALWQRARMLVAGPAPRPSPDGSQAGVDVAAALPGEGAEQAGLVDAVDDPGDPGRYSEQGYRRIESLRRELAALRRRLDQPLPELVADVERTLGLNIEAMARPGRVGRAHLDAFADVVTGYAEASPTASLRALLDYLATAETAEDGLEPGEVEVSPDRVQVLTVHAAKGLEWEVVAVPQLVAGVFPGRKRSSSWLKTITELPAELRGDAEDLPALRVSAGDDRKEMAEALAVHEAEFEERRLTEERRLLYVALTRSRRCLLLSGHWWSEGGRKPRGPSPFLVELRELLSAEPGIGVVARWCDPPSDGEQNPLAARARSMQWPSDPLGVRREDVSAAAAMVLAEIGEVGAPDRAADAEDDPDGWSADVDVLLAEREAAGGRRESVTLPSQLSVSQLVELAADPDALARRLRRPLPFPPNPSARRGTAFHAWLEHRFRSAKLLDLDELPGAADEGAAPDAHLDVLKAAFEAGEWAHRSPHDVEVPFETIIDGYAVRGRMDAVFADADGGWTVVDWKTGAMPDAQQLRSVAVQLAAYRLAWAALSGGPLTRVRAAFHYVRHDHTVRPADLLDAEGLRALLRSVPAPD